MTCVTKDIMKEKKNKSGCSRERANAAGCRLRFWVFLPDSVTTWFCCALVGDSEQSQTTVLFSDIFKKMMRRAVMRIPLIPHGALLEGLLQMCSSTPQTLVWINYSSILYIHVAVDASWLSSSTDIIRSSSTLAATSCRISNLDLWSQSKMGSRD